MRTGDRVCPTCIDSAEEPLWRRQFPIDREADEANTRREFMKLLTVLSGAFTLANVGLAARSLFARVRGRPASTSVSLARIPGAEGLDPGRSLGFTLEDGVPGLLIRLASGDYVAYDRRCTHLSCPVLWNEDQRQATPSWVRRNALWSRSPWSIAGRRCGRPEERTGELHEIEEFTSRGFCRRRRPASVRDRPVRHTGLDAANRS